MIFVMEIYRKIVTQSATTSDSMIPNQWNLVTGTYDSSTRAIKIYLNGVLGGTKTFSAGYANPNLDVNTTAVQIGKRINTERVIGGLDDVRLYNKALTASEIDALYLMGTH